MYERSCSLLSSFCVLCRLDSQAKTGHCVPWSQKFQMPGESGATFMSSTFGRQGQRGLIAWLKHARWCCIMGASSARLRLLDAASAGLLQEALFPSLYLAKTAVLWVASILSLEQRKYCNTCQELNFIFKSCFLQN